MIYYYGAQKPTRINLREPVFLLLTMYEICFLKASLNRVSKANCFIIVICMYDLKLFFALHNIKKQAYYLIDNPRVGLL